MYLVGVYVTTDLSVATLMLACSVDILFVKPSFNWSVNPSPKAVSPKLVSIGAIESKVAFKTLSFFITSISIDLP